MPSAAGLAAAPAVALVAGAACVLVALALLLMRRGPLLMAPFVLAIGAALLALPWIAGGDRAAAPVEDAPVPAVVASVEVSSDGLRTVAGAAPPTTPPPPIPGRPASRIAVEAAEAEPNDTLAAANVAELGIAITGTLAPGDLDFFAFDPPPGFRGEIVAALTVLAGNAGLTLYDDSGAPLGSNDTREQISVRTTSLARMIEAPRYYVLVRQASEDAGPATYHLTVAARHL